MYGHVQYIKWSRDKGEFLVKVDSLISDVVNEVRDRLSEEYKGEVERILNLVNFRSHPDHSALVVTPHYDAHDRLVERMYISMQHHVCAVLAERAEIRRAS